MVVSMWRECFCETTTWLNGRLLFVHWTRCIVQQSSHFVDWKELDGESTLRCMQCVAPLCLVHEWPWGALGLLIVTCRMVVVLVRTCLYEVVHIHPMVQSMNGIDRPLFEQSFFSRRGCLIFLCTVFILRSIEEPINRTYVVALLEWTDLVLMLVNETINGKDNKSR